MGEKESEAEEKKTSASRAPGGQGTVQGCRAVREESMSSGTGTLSCLWVPHLPLPLQEAERPPLRMSCRTATLSPAEAHLARLLTFTCQVTALGPLARGLPGLGMGLSPGTGGLLCLGGAHPPRAWSCSPAVSPAALKAARPGFLSQPSVAPAGPCLHPGASSASGRGRLLFKDSRLLPAHLLLRPGTQVWAHWYFHVFLPGPGKASAAGRYRQEATHWPQA